MLTSTGEDLDRLRQVSAPQVPARDVIPPRSAPEPAPRLPIRRQRPVLDVESSLPVEEPTISNSSSVTEDNVSPTSAIDEPTEYAAEPDAKTEVESRDAELDKCRNIHSRPNPCEYVRQECPPDSIIDYLGLYYCELSSAKPMFYVVAILLILIYFYTLYHISDVYLTNALQQLSNFMNMSNEVAGLTLLSFGNSAPDFFTALAGVSTDGLELILSSSISGGIFVTTIVLGSVIIGAVSYYNHTNGLVNDPERTVGNSRDSLTLPPPPSGKDSPTFMNHLLNQRAFRRIRRRLRNLTRPLRQGTHIERQQMALEHARRADPWFSSPTAPARGIPASGLVGSMTELTASKQPDRHLANLQVVYNPNSLDSHHVVNGHTLDGADLSMKASSSFRGYRVPTFHWLRMTIVYGIAVAALTIFSFNGRIYDYEAALLFVGYMVFLLSYLAHYLLRRWRVWRKQQQQLKEQTVSAVEGQGQPPHSGIAASPQVGNPNYLSEKPLGDYSHEMSVATTPTAAERHLSAIPDRISEHQVPNCRAYIENQMTGTVVAATPRRQAFMDYSAVVTELWPQTSEFRTRPVWSILEVIKFPLHLVVRLTIPPILNTVGEIEESDSSDDEEDDDEIDDNPIDESELKAGDYRGHAAELDDEVATLPAESFHHSASTQDWAKFTDHRPSPLDVTIPNYNIGHEGKSGTAIPPSFTSEGLAAPRASPSVGEGGVSRRLSTWYNYHFYQKRFSSSPNLSAGQAEATPAADPNEQLNDRRGPGRKRSWFGELSQFRQVRTDQSTGVSTNEACVTAHVEPSAANTLSPPAPRRQAPRIFIDDYTQEVPTRTEWLSGSSFYTVTSVATDDSLTTTASSTSSYLYDSTDSGVSTTEESENQPSFDQPGHSSVSATKVDSPQVVEASLIDQRDQTRRQSIPPNWVLDEPVTEFDDYSTYSPGTASFHTAKPSIDSSMVASPPFPVGQFPGRQSPEIRVRDSLAFNRSSWMTNNSNDADESFYSLPSPTQGAPPHPLRLTGIDAQITNGDGSGNTSELGQPDRMAFWATDGRQGHAPARDSHTFGRLSGNRSEVGSIIDPHGVPSIIVDAEEYHSEVAAANAAQRSTVPVPGSMHGGMLEGLDWPSMSFIGAPHYHMRSASEPEIGYYEHPRSGMVHPPHQSQAKSEHEVSCNYEKGGDSSSQQPQSPDYPPWTVISPILGSRSDVMRNRPDSLSSIVPASASAGRDRSYSPVPRHSADYAATHSSAGGGSASRQPSIRVRVKKLRARRAKSWKPSKSAVDFMNRLIHLTATDLRKYRLLLVITALLSPVFALYILGAKNDPISAGFPIRMYDLIVIVSLVYCSLLVACTWHTITLSRVYHQLFTAYQFQRQHPGQILALTKYMELLDIYSPGANIEASLNITTAAADVTLRSSVSPALVPDTADSAPQPVMSSPILELPGKARSQVRSNSCASSLSAHSLTSHALPEPPSAPYENDVVNFLGFLRSEKRALQSIQENLPTKGKAADGNAATPADSDIGIHHRNPYFILTRGGSMLPSRYIERQMYFQYYAELLLSILAFAVCILWIYATANELVALIETIGVLLDIPDRILGATVLAWGNSVGDLFADVAMARAGYFYVAITAVFTSPILNAMLSLGINFFIQIMRTDIDHLSLPQFAPPLMFSFFYLLFIIFILCVLVVPCLLKFRLPKYFGYLLYFFFVLYTVGIVVSEALYTAYGGN